MSILNYIEKIKRENEGPRITTQEPRNMKLAKAEIPRHLWDNVNTPDLEQSPDSFLKPGETLEDWDTTFRRPNAEGGQIIGKPGGLVEPGIEYYGNVKVTTPKNFVTIEGLTNYLPFSKENLEDAYSRLDRPSEIRNALKSSGIKLIKYQKKPGGMKYNIFKIPTETQIDNFWEN